MNCISPHRWLRTVFVLLVAGGAGAALAQAARPAADTSCNCSNPVNVHLVKNSGSTTPLASDFRADMRLNQQPYNATAPNTHFADTLQWRMPASKTCELTGKLTVKLKNLGTSLASNDGATVVSNGVPVPGFSQAAGTLWTAGQGAGALKTISHQLTGAMMQQGRLSYFVQDDTAVQEIRLDISGCCINPTR